MPVLWEEVYFAGYMAIMLKCSNAKCVRKSLELNIVVHGI